MANSGKGTPKKTEESLQEAMRRVSMRAAVDALAFKQRVQALQDAFDGTVLQGAGGSGVSRTSRRRPGEVLYEALKLQLQIANEVLSFGQSQADFWLDRVQRAGVASLPEDQRPAVRVPGSSGPDGEVTWRVFVFNAAHEPRTVDLKGRWKKGPWAQGAPPAWTCAAEGVDKSGDFVVPPRAERELVFKQSLRGHVALGETYVAKVKVRMRGRKKSTTSTTVVGKLELALTVEERSP